MGRLNQTALDIIRFWSKVKKTKNCWLWQAHLNKKGYGIFYFEKKVGMAHRFAYTRFVGEVKTGFSLDHLCRVKNCVNPKHLEAVTARENSLRGFGVGGICHRRHTCLKGHPYTKENTNIKITKNGGVWRICRACQRISGAILRRTKGIPVRVFNND